MAKKKRITALSRTKGGALALPPKRLVSDLRQLIEQSRQQVARTINSALVWLYWNIGKRIRDDILKEDRADYGSQIVATLSRQLAAEYGRGFGRRNLFRMIRFAEVFPEEEIVSSLMTQLSWTHLIYIIPFDDPLKRDFYAEMSRLEGWSVRTLQNKIDGMLFERTALSKKPDLLIRQELDALRDEDRVTPDLLFRDPYLLDFLGLRDTYAEKDLESAILREMEAFILELGVGFAFLERQKRIIVDGEDYYLDLLFYHRRLRRLIAIDLKIGRFQASDKGQMELYLRWLEKHETHSDEHSPLGLILCAGKSEERVELLQLEAAGIRVAEYLTELPPKDVLEKKLYDAIRLARQRLTHEEDTETTEEPPKKARRHEGKK